MKLPVGSGSGSRYDLRRSVVLEVLTRHYVTVGRELQGQELYLLERDDDFIYVSLPDIVPAAMVFRLANKYRIPPEEFYTENKSGLH